MLGERPPGGLDGRPVGDLEAEGVGHLEEGVTLKQAHCSQSR